MCTFLESLVEAVLSGSELDGQVSALCTRWTLCDTTWTGEAQHSSIQNLINILVFEAIV